MKIVCLVCAMVMMLTTQLFAIEYVGGKEVKLIEGEIVDFDTQRGIITVRWLQDAYTVQYNEMSIQVTSDTKIFKGSDTLTVDDLNSGDLVSIRVVAQDAGAPKAVSIMVTE